MEKSKIKERTHIRFIRRPLDKSSIPKARGGKGKGQQSVDLQEKFKKSAKKIIRMNNQSLNTRKNFFTINLPKMKDFEAELGNEQKDHSFAMDEDQFPIKPTITEHERNQVYVKPNYFFKKVQSVPTMRLGEQKKETMLSSLSVNRAMQNSLGEFYNEVRTTLRRSMQENITEWDSKQRSCNKLRVVNTETIESDTDAFKWTKHKRQLSLNGSTDASKRRGLEPLKSKRPGFPSPLDLESEVFLEGTWSKVTMIVPFVNNENSQVALSNGNLLMLASQRESEPFCIWKLNFKTGQLDCITFTKGLDFDRRGFSLRTFNERVVVYGGENPTLNFVSKGIHRDALVFDIQERTFKRSTPPKHLNCSRKRHACLMIQHCLLIHGGYNEEEEMTNSLIYFNCLDLKWSILLSSTKTPPLIDHAIAGAFSPISKVVDPLTPCEYVPRSKPSVNEGVYIFGGRDCKGRESNLLWKLKIFANPIQTEAVQTKGRAPTPRSGHSLQYLSIARLLVVFGGFSEHEKNSKRGGFLNDLFVLSISKLSWLEVRMGKYSPEPRASFCSFTNGILEANQGPRILIFGGINNSNFLPSSLDYFEIEELGANKQKAADRDPLNEQISKKLNEYLKKKKAIKEKTRHWDRQKSYLPLPNDNYNLVD